MDIAKHSTTVLTMKGDTALSIVMAGIAAADAGCTYYEERERQAQANADRDFPANYFKTAAQEQFDLYWDLKAALSCFPASTLPEAAAQIGQTINEIDLAYEDFPEGKEVDAAFRKMKTKIERLLFSALRALEQIGSFALDDMGLQSLRNSNVDPWAEADALVARLQKDGIK